MIISHHPLLFHGLKHLTGSSPQERCVAMAVKHDIAIYSAHTSLDNALHGVSGRMAEKLGISEYKILVPQADNNRIGLGVIGELPIAMPLQDWLEHVRPMCATRQERRNSSAEWRYAVVQALSSCQRP